ncbi:MAG: diaminopimelate epimerase [Pseudomonadota bacterium]
MAEFTFSKMHGLGNDFVVIDAIKHSVSLSVEQIQRLSNRRTGIGFDQLLLVEAAQSDQADFRYRIFNADGGEVEHCGNGARCFVRFVHQHQLSDRNPLVVETQNGIISLKAQAGGMVRVNMGVPSFDPADLPFIPEQTQLNPHYVIIDGERIEFGVVSVGNPHAVVLVDNIDTAEVERIGTALQQHASFPQQVNVGFLQIDRADEVRLRVFERGAGETQACGTGTCAAVAYARQQGLVSDDVLAHLLGGDLCISYAGEGSDLYMTGPTDHVYNGHVSID